MSILFGTGSSPAPRAVQHNGQKSQQLLNMMLKTCFYRLPRYLSSQSIVTIHKKLLPKGFTKMVLAPLINLHGVKAKKG